MVNDESASIASALLGQATLYRCPVELAELVPSWNQLLCGTCGRAYPILPEGIVLLDTILGADHTAFDPAAAQTEILTDLQRQQAAVRCERFLNLGEIDSLENGTVLDVGCGLGDLTNALASTNRVRNCEIYAFDHSIESLRVATRSISLHRGNRVYLSCQDASALCFPSESFDLIVGSAVLHHILDWKRFLTEIQGILKPGSSAVFAEPFRSGYLLFAMLLKLAIERLDLDPEEIKKPEFGYCEFILNNIAFRAQNAANQPALTTLTDKHLFSNEEIMAFGHAARFKASHVENYFPPECYETSMDWFLATYGIVYAPLAELCRQFHDSVRSYTGTAFPEVFSHFKYVAFRK